VQKTPIIYWLDLYRGGVNWNITLKSDGKSKRSLLLLAVLTASDGGDFRFISALSLLFGPRCLSGFCAMSNMYEA
jgi:hypothetical protein